MKKILFIGLGLAFANGATIDLGAMEMSVGVPEQKKVADAVLAQDLFKPLPIALHIFGFLFYGSIHIPGNGNELRDLISVVANLRATCRYFRTIIHSDACRELIFKNIDNACESSKSTLSSCGYDYKTYEPCKKAMVSLALLTPPSIAYVMENKPWYLDSLLKKIESADDLRFLFDGSVSKKYVDFRDGDSYMTLLMKASSEGDYEKTKLLLAYGAAVNEKQSPQGKTALHIACEHGHLNIVKELLKYNPDIAIRDNTVPEASALAYACFYSKREIVALLLEHAAHNNNVRIKSDIKQILTTIKTYEKTIDKDILDLLHAYKSRISSMRDTNSGSTALIEHGGNAHDKQCQII